MLAVGVLFAFAMVFGVFAFIANERRRRSYIQLPSQGPRARHIARRARIFQEYRGRVRQVQNDEFGPTRETDLADACERFECQLTWRIRETLALKNT